MPTTPYAKALVRIAGGALQSGGITVSASQSVALEGENTAGWTKSRWEIKGPPGWSVPAGWTDESGVAVYVGTTGAPPSWTLPAASGWGKWMVRLIVNDGEKYGDLAHPEMTDTTLALSMVSANSLEDLGEGEEAQFGRAWTGSLQESMRVIDAALGLISGAAELVTLTETRVTGDWVCGANDPDPDKVKLAVTAALANANAVRGMLLTGGINGDRVELAGQGDVVTAAACGLSPAATTDPVVLNVTTGKAERKASPHPTDYQLGVADKQGNLTIAIVSPLLLGGVADTFIASGSIPLGYAFCSANDPAESSKVVVATAAALKAAGGLVLGVALESASDGDTFLAASTGDVLDASIFSELPNTIASLSTGVVDTVDGSVMWRLEPFPSDYVVGFFSTSTAGAPATFTVQPSRPTGEATVINVFDPKWGYDGLERDGSKVLNEILRKVVTAGCAIEVGHSPADQYGSTFRLRWDEVYIDFNDIHAQDCHLRLPNWGIEFRGNAGKPGGSYNARINCELNDFGDNGTGFSNAGKQASLLALTGDTMEISLPLNDIMPLFAPTTLYRRGDVFRPASRNGYVWRCYVEGTSGGSEPTPSTTVDATVQSGTAWFRLEPERPTFPINPKEWVDHWIWIERAATRLHNGRYLVLAVNNDGSDGNPVRLQVQLRGTYAGNILGSDANNGSIAWRLMRSAFHVRQRMIYWRDIEFYQKEGYYCSFIHYWTQSPYTNSAVVTDHCVRRCTYGSYPPASYDSTWNVYSAFNREIGNASMSPRVLFVQAAQALAWPIAVMPGSSNFAPPNMTSGATLWAAGQSISVGDIRRGSTPNGWWWEATSSGTTAGTIPSAMNAYTYYWGTTVTDGGGVQWRSVFAGATSSALQTAWSAGASVAVGDVRRFTVQSRYDGSANGGGGFVLKCIKAGVTGSTEPLPYRSGEVVYNVYDKIVDGTAEWRLLFNAGQSNKFAPYNCDYNRSYLTSAIHMRAYQWIDNEHGQSREHYWEDPQIVFAHYGMVTGGPHTWGTARYAENGGYAGIDIVRGDCAVASDILRVQGNFLYFHARSLHTESNGRILYVQGPGGEVKIQDCRFTSDDDLMNRARQWAYIADCWQVDVDNTSARCFGANARWEIVNASPTTTTTRIRFRDYVGTGAIPPGYGTRSSASYQGPWKIAGGETLVVRWTQTLYEKYYDADAIIDWTCTLKQLPVMAGSTAYVVGDIVVAPGAWTPYQWRCRVAGTTAAGTPAPSASSIGVDFVSGTATFVSEYNTTIQNLNDVRAHEVAAAINRDIDIDWRPKRVYTAGQVIVPLNQKIEPIRQYRAVGSGTGSANQPTWTQTLGASVVDGGVTLTCEEATVPRAWAFADQTETVFTEGFGLTGFAAEEVKRYHDDFGNGRQGSTQVGVASGTGATLFNLSGYSTYAPHGLDLQTAGLVSYQNGANSGNASTEVDAQIDARLLSAADAATPVAAVNVRYVEGAAGPFRRNVLLTPTEERTWQSSSSTGIPLKNTGGELVFDGTSIYASTPFVGDFEWDPDYQVNLTRVSASSGVVDVGPPEVSATRFGVAAVRSAPVGAGNREVWRYTLTRPNVPSVLTGRDGSTTSAGTVLTSSLGGLPTDSSLVGGTLEITRGLAAGTYTIASHTATTITITGGTFPATDTQQDFRVRKAKTFDFQHNISSATCLGIYLDEDLATLTTPAAWDSAGGTGWVNRAEGANALGTLWQNTDAAVPTIGQDADGTYYADFAGGDYVQTSGTITEQAKPLHMFVVFQATSTDAGNAYLIDGKTKSCGLYFVASTDWLYMTAGTGTNIINGTYDLQSRYRVLAAKVETGQIRTPHYAGRMMIDGLDTPYHAYGNIGANGLDGLTVGAAFGGGSTAKARIKAVVIYKGEMTMADQGRVMFALRSRYGLLDNMQRAALLRADAHGLSATKAAADGAAGTTTAETPVGRAPEAMLTGQEWYVTPTAALTASDTDYATITLYKRTAGGGSVQIGQITTKTGGGGGTGNWTAWAPIEIATTASVALGDVITYDIAKSGAGVVVPSFVLDVGMVIA